VKVPVALEFLADPAAVGACVAALLVAWRGKVWFESLLRAPRRLTLSILALAAALLSAGYVHHYLRGGPRVIDATSYWLEGRSLAEGHASWPLHEPTAAVRGRFLLVHGAPQAPRIGVIFPPGYPLVLAIGFWLGHPLWVGPVIAGLLVLATYELARRVSRRDDVAWLAALLSVFCATLRYHTADTMSHGWAALLWTASLAFVYGAGDPGRHWPRAACAGLTAGWLVATRPMSALALLPVLAYAATELRGSTRWVLALSMLPPLSLFIVEQQAVTGSYFTSSQAAYYAVADGPPGCFRYGFGAGIGCLHEHGDYVAAVLPHGFGWRAALLTTFRRVWIHLRDAFNAEPLALFLALGAPLLLIVRRRAENDVDRPRGRRVVSLALAVPAIVVAYLPFYFDGSYPGGGARFYADVLPIEHVLLAMSVALFAAHRWSRGTPFARLASWTCTLSLLGFGVRASAEHRLLRDRDGGRPFFEPAVLTKARVDRGLMFVGSDHGFNLAYDPQASDAHTHLVVSREYGDDRDRMVWEELGRPAAYRYVFDGRETPSPVLAPWSAGPVPHPYRYEAEAEWPPLAQEGGWFEPVFATGTCAWGGRLLAVHTDSPDQPFRGTISFPVPRPGRFRIGVHVASRGEVVSRFVLRKGPGSVPIATWTFVPSRRDFACATLPEQDVNLSGYGLLEVTARQGSALFLDAIALEPAGSGDPAH
jgi:hypothetical protein